jgi:hypothetical protein
VNGNRNTYTRESIGQPRMSIVIAGGVSLAAQADNDRHGATSNSCGDLDTKKPNV